MSKTTHITEKMMAEMGERIDREARELLSELQKVEGWECMIKACEGHYSQYPKQFFGWCSVTHTDDAVQFVKGYSGGDEYEVLEISFRKSLKDQVRDRKIELEEQRKKQVADEREKDIAEMERIKGKYGL